VASQLHVYYARLRYRYQGRPYVLGYAIDAENPVRAQEKARSIFEARQMADCLITSVKVALLHGTA
jgi:hypothetical protein